MILLHFVQLFQLCADNAALFRILLLDFPVASGEHAGGGTTGDLSLVVPVVHALVTKQQNAHICGIVCHGTLYVQILVKRVCNTALFRLGFFRFIQTGQQQDQKSHVIA